MGEINESNIMVVMQNFEISVDDNICWIIPCYQHGIDDEQILKFDVLFSYFSDSELLTGCILW